MENLWKNEPGSARLYCENRHVNGRVIKEKPSSTLDVKAKNGADTYLNSLPLKCEITKDDRDMIQKGE